MEEGCCDKHQIISDFYDKILGFVIKNIEDIEVAKDITQDVMGRLIEAYDKNTQVSNIRAWLFQITRNLIADHYRKNKYRDDNKSSQNELSLSEEQPDVSTEDFIIPMIKLLPDEYGKALFLSDIENLKQAEVAKRLNLKLSATKMRIQRARKMLHELFLDCCEIEYTKDGSFANCTIKSHCNELLNEEEKLKNKNSSNP